MTKKKLCADKPCPTCPWRKSSTVGGEDIPGFSIEMMRNLATTVPPRGSKDDGFYQVMACHHSSEDHRYTCAGYLAQEGERNINVRLMASQGQIDMVKVRKNCEGLDLYPDFFSMLDDYEAAQ